MLKNDLLINPRVYLTIYFIIKIENKNLVISLELEPVLMGLDDLFLSVNILVETMIRFPKMIYLKIIHKYYFVLTALINYKKLKMYNIFLILVKLIMITEIYLSLIFRITIMD